MKNGFLITFILITTFYSHSQTIVWKKCYGGTLDESSYSINKISDNRFLVVGSESSGNGDISHHHFPVINSASDYWIVILDSIGNILFEKNYGGTLDEIAYSGIQTYDNGFLIAGKSDSQDGDVQGTINSSNDFWIVKADSVGAIQWQRNYGGSQYDAAREAIQTIDSGYLVVGYTSSWANDVSGFHGGEDVWIVKLAKNGTIQWERAYGGSGYEEGESCLQTQDNGYIFIAKTLSNDGDVAGNHANTGADIWVVKIDSIGNIEWQKCYGGSNVDYPCKILSKQNGNYIISGTSSSNDGDLTFNYGQSDYWVFEIDSMGNLIWQKTFGGISNEQAESACLNFNNTISISGIANANDSLISGVHGSWDYWIVTLDSLGNFLESSIFGGTGSDIPYSITSLNDSSLIISGVTDSNDGDVTGNHGGKDYWVLKFNSALYNEAQDLASDQYFKIKVLNKNEISLQSNYGSHIRGNIFVTNIEGKICFNTKFTISNGTNLIYLPMNLKAGVYFINLIIGDNKYFKCIKIEF
jgi:hypothetical protein